jgi:hypothetical protein
MSKTVDDDLYRRTVALLEPGEIELAGMIIHTTLSGAEDLEMQELTVDINEIVAEHAEKGECFIYAGNDDSDFASNQFQGLTLTDEEFVWECQQLLRDGSFDLVWYYEAEPNQEALAKDVESLESVDRVTLVP